MHRTVLGDNQQWAQNLGRALPLAAACNSLALVVTTCPTDSMSLLNVTTSILCLAPACLGLCHILVQKHVLGLFNLHAKAKIIPLGVVEPSSETITCSIDPFHAE